MPWVKIDDLMPQHPKMLRAGPLACWLHVCALAYANRNLTDGFIAKEIAPTLVHFDGIRDAGKRVDVGELVRRLVKEGVWERTKGGFQIHDFLEYQPSKEEEIARREADSETKRRAGLVRAAGASRTKGGRFAKGDAKVNRLVTPADTSTDTSRDTSRDTSAAGVLDQRPTSPGPVPQSKSSSAGVPEPRPLAGLISIGLKRGQALELIDEYGEQAVGEQLLNLSRRPDVTKPAGWIVAALRDGYELAEEPAPYNPPASMSPEDAEAKARLMFPERFADESASA